jgi:hypothetical protein
VRGPACEAALLIWDQHTESVWHAPCFRGRIRRLLQMYSILYIIGAIVVIIVVLRLLGLV